jgi:magnesium chelatase family protein
MIGTMLCAVLDGFGAKNVRVEADIARGLPAFFMVGLAENSVKEARVRVQSAITNAGFKFPGGKISVNLAPADLQKRGTAFDLSIALAILQANKDIAPEKLANIAAIGELSLNGEIRPVRGMLALAESVKSQGLKYLLVPRENSREASLIPGLIVKIVSNFSQLVGAVLAGKIEELDSPPPESEFEEAPDENLVDMSDVCGQEEARRALLIAAAGNHNLLFIGGPGSGKSMMAYRLTTILPPLGFEESLTLTKIYSLAGLTLSGNLINKRPFRAPHHSTTKAGLIGGGSILIRPGEISLATFGVLFLDELLEFPRPVLEVLRQPLESGEITLSRANHSITYPADISLAGALNPCPCGNYGQGKKICICSPLAITKYQSRLSGPLIDRIDLHINVPPVDLHLMNSHEITGESSSSMRSQVINARAQQHKRLGANKTNGKMSKQNIKYSTNFTSKAHSFLVNSAESLHMSARGFDRIMRLARTIADLEESSHVHEHHVGEALYYRPTLGLVKKC